MNIDSWIGMSILLVGIVVFVWNVNKGQGQGQAMPGSTISIMVGFPIGILGLIILGISLLIQIV